MHELRIGTDEAIRIHSEGVYTHDKKEGNSLARIAMYLQSTLGCSMLPRNYTTILSTEDTQTSWSHLTLFSDNRIAKVEVKDYVSHLQKINTEVFFFRKRNPRLAEAKMIHYTQCNKQARPPLKWYRKEQCHSAADIYIKLQEEMGGK